MENLLYLNVQKCLHHNLTRFIVCFPFLFLTFVYPGGNVSYLCNSQKLLTANVLSFLFVLVNIVVYSNQKQKSY